MIDEIIGMVCRYYGIKREDMIGRDKRQSIVNPRALAMFLIRRNTNLSLKEIGKIFDRHYTTVIHSVNYGKFGDKEITMFQPTISILKNSQGWDTSATTIDEDLKRLLLIKSDIDSLIESIQTRKDG